MKKRMLVPVLCAVALSTSACSGNASSGKAETTTAAETTAEAETATEEETTTVPETEAVSENIPMGQAAKVGEWNVTVSNMQILDTIADGYGNFTPESGNKYLLITMTASNEGKKSDSFLPSFSIGDDTHAKVIYGDGYEFSQTHLLGYSRSMIDSTVNPLSSKEGDVAFEIPESVASATDPLILEISCGNETVNFTLR
ncbi:MAG: DUF4352 domain-containing protein [Hungatella sp.]|nr:DUF4352 domain-containing protein [Hungatella sp.]